MMVTKASVLKIICLRDRLSVKNFRESQSDCLRQSVSLESELEHNLVGPSKSFASDSHRATVGRISRAIA